MVQTAGWFVLQRYEAQGRDDYLFRLDNDWVVDATIKVQNSAPCLIQQRGHSASCYTCNDWVVDTTLKVADAQSSACDRGHTLIASAAAHTPVAARRQRSSSPHSSLCAAWAPCLP